MKDRRINTDLKEVELLALCSMVSDDENYDNRYDKPIEGSDKTYGRQVYEFGGATITYNILSSTATNPFFEVHGLQGSFVEINTEKVIVFRKTEMPDSRQGFRDWLQDLDLLNPFAYESEHSQFKDLEKWIATLGLSKAELKNVIFTGYSLGGALASAAAIKYGAAAIVFSAVSAYNMLNPSERLKIKNARVKNLYRSNDIVAYLPIGVPRIGQQIMIKGKFEKKGGFIDLFKPAGHSLQGFVIEEGQLVRGASPAMIEGIIGSLGIGIGSLMLGHYIRKHEVEKRQATAAKFKERKMQAPMAEAGATDVQGSLLSDTEGRLVATKQPGKTAPKQALHKQNQSDQPALNFTDTTVDITQADQVKQTKAKKQSMTTKKAKKATKTPKNKKAA